MLSQRSSPKQFRHQIRRPVLTREIVHGEDVRVVQRTGGASLVFKSREMRLVVRESGGEQLDGNFAGEPRIARPVYLSHAAGTDGFDDLVRPKMAPGLEPDPGLARRHRRL